MELKGVHFLLTYRCDMECNHCFVWGSPKARGVFTLKQINNILEETKKLETVRYIAIEGGEPFLYYPILVKTVEEAVKLGFSVEILSNCYWATCPEDAAEWLKPMVNAKNVELSISSDPYHGDSWVTEESKNAVKVTRALNLKVGINTVKCPNIGMSNPPNEIEGAKVGLWELMYRGRATSKLIEEASKKSWREFTKCPYENFAKQERVHVDPFGHVHVCQGISIGNAWQKPFSKIVTECDPFEHPILAPLIDGGPVALVERFHTLHEEAYADACHLCYSVRCTMRDKYPDILVPDEMYGEPE